MTEIKWIRLSELEAAPRNPKGHALDDIVASIKRFGFVDPVVLDGRLAERKRPVYRLVAGHGRTEALRSMQANGDPIPDGIGEGRDDWMVPCVAPVFANAREAEAYLLASNRLTEKGAWEDGAQLQSMLAELAESDGLVGTGFTEDDERDLAAMLADHAPESASQGDVAEIGSRYEIVVECADQAQMEAVFNRLTEEGYSCRTLIL